MSTLTIVGVDPGPTTGVGVMLFEDALGAWECTRTAVFQCDLESAPWLVAVCLDWQGAFAYKVLAVERYVIGSRSSKVSHAGASSATRQLIGNLEQQAFDRKVVFRQRAAGEVKPWATDLRLTKAGFKLPKGMTHGADGCRHGLFSAVHDCGVPDPLSKKAFK